jgi:hypothetical protein
MKQNQYVICGIIITLLAAIILSGCGKEKEMTAITDSTPPEATTESAPLYATYHYGSETAFVEIKINNSKLIYTHLDDEKIKDKCAQWVEQSPCWTETDIVIEEAELANKEIGDLRNLILQTKVMELESYYGPEGPPRCYPYMLTIDIDSVKKEVVYCSRPDTPPAPEAFTAVTQKITEIVDEKFS